MQETYTQFRTEFAQEIFNNKYKHKGAETWEELAHTLAWDVCGDHIPNDMVEEIAKMIAEMKFIPGGRYLYYAGRPNKYFNNCYLLRSEEDSREDWANLSWKAESCLMTGGGIGNDYSIYRPEGTPITKTGGLASGPIPKMQMINEIGRHVMQGGSRRSAIYASLNWKHADAEKFLYAKDWHNMPVGKTGKSVWDIKQDDFNYPAPLDMTNISLNYDNQFLDELYGELGWSEVDGAIVPHPGYFNGHADSIRLPNLFVQNVEQAMRTGEPGFSFNFGSKENETLRNAPVSAETYVLTDEGYVQIKDIINKTVKLWTGKQYAETEFVKTKANVRTVAIGMTGGRKIYADPEHEFFVERYRGKGKRRKLAAVEKVPASDLNINDTLVVSMPEYSKVEFDIDAYILGYAYGDGSFHNKYDRAEITFCTDESKRCVLPMEGSSLIKSITYEDKRGYTRMYLTGYEEISLKDRKKDIYPVLSVEQIPAFVAGLFDADGNNTNNRPRVSSIHKEFLEGLRRDLERIGILSIITTAGRTSYSDRQAYSLSIMSEYVTYFSEIIPTHRLDVLPHQSHRESKIKVTSISNGRIEDVYCCDVKVPEHSFMAEGVIISNCTEVTSEDDSDVCNLGSLNMSRIETLEEFSTCTELATIFLLCGTLKAKLPYDKVYKTREKNRRLGLGLMGVHEWLLKRGSRYEVTPELHDWLRAYRDVSDLISARTADLMGISRPVANRAIAPTGTIGILAGTTTGIEPLFAVAYKRRYLKNGTEWHYQYVVDGSAKDLIQLHGLDPDKMESAIDLAMDPERRIKFQADVQDYVDMSISSTLNLPAWDTELNNSDKVLDFSKIVAKYAHRLRGLTFYPDGARGGQPLTPVSYEEAIKHEGAEYKEEYTDVCDLTGGGTCGI